MLRLPPFDYVSPRTLSEATRILAECGGDALLVGGGTDVFPSMKRRIMEPRTVVSLGQVSELQGIRGNGQEGLTIGAMTKLQELATNPDVAAHYPALAMAANAVANLPIRNAATVGGNLCSDTRCNFYDMPYLWRKAADFCMKKGSNVCRVAPGGSRCWAVSSSDLAPVAVALGASVRLASAQGERTIPAEDLYRDDGIEYLNKRPDEILVELILPRAHGLQSTYLKLRRREATDFPALSVAASARFDDDARCNFVRIVLGAAGPTPLLLREALDILVGNRLTPERIEAMGQAAYRVVKPLDNTDFSPYYRKRIAHVYVVRALRGFAMMAGSVRSSP